MEAILSKVESVDKKRDDKVILERRLSLYNENISPKVGEYLKYKGEYVRFTHDWEDSLQTGTGGSFYLGEGYISFSGSLNHGVSKKDIELTQEVRKGYVWFFHRDVHMADNGVDFNVPLRVWKIKKGVKVKVYDVLGVTPCPKCKSIKTQWRGLGCKYECLNCKAVY